MPFGHNAHGPKTGEGARPLFVEAGCGRRLSALCSCAQQSMPKVTVVMKQLPVATSDPQLSHAEVSGIMLPLDDCDLHSDQYRQHLLSKILVKCY